MPQCNIACPKGHKRDRDIARFAAINHLDRVCGRDRGRILRPSTGRRRAAYLNHVGESACICGFVASSHYAPTSKPKPTFLNLEKPYPNQRFTAVIFGDDRSKFGEPERTFQGKQGCSTLTWGGSGQGVR